MIRIHPHEYVYFNFLAGNNTKDNYELDYYGVSSKQALEYILRTDTASKINITGSSAPQQLNLDYLPLEDRSRIAYTDIEFADYFINQPRGSQQTYNFKDERYSIKVGNANIISVYKLTSSEKAKLETNGRVVLKCFTDFENQPKEWGVNNLCQPATGAHSGKLVTMVDEKNNSSDGIILTQLDSIYNKKDIILKLSYWTYADKGAITCFVADITDSKGTCYFWAGVDALTFKVAVNKWDKRVAKYTLPIIKSPTDKIKLYLWDVGGQKVYIDDLSAEFIEKTAPPVSP
jgi:hypothetical protein